MLDETTPRKLNGGVRNRSISSMPDVPVVPTSVKGFSRKNQFINVLEELEKSPDHCQLENIAAYMKEDFTERTEYQEKGKDERGLATGIMLEGKYLHKEHLLQPRALMSNSSKFAEKCPVIWKVSDRKGNGLTQKKVAEIVPCLQRTRTFENSISPLNPLCSTQMYQSNSDSEGETELPRSTIQEDEFIREKDLLSTSSDPISFESFSRAGIIQNAVYSRPSSLVKRPKDFVCPITDQIFEDPVTIETGQTYEYAAIQEWLNRGNTTCPVTQHTLESLALPKTNFVIKRVVDAWKSEHPGILTGHGHSNVRLVHANSSEFRTENQVDLSGPAKGSPRQCSGKPNVNSHMETSGPSFSLTRHFSQITGKSFDSTLSVSHSFLSNMKQAIATLCTSKNLIECENAALNVFRVWLESNSHPLVEAILSKAAIIAELMEVLSISENEEVLQNTVYILAELAVKSEINRKRILKADRDLEIIMRILKSSIFPQGVVLVYLLKLPIPQLDLLDMIPMLVGVPENSSDLEHLNPTHCTPQEAAVSLLEQLLTVFDHTKNLENAKQVIALEGIPFLLRRIELGNLHEKITAASVLSCCMHADGRCRHMLVNDIKRASIVQLLHYNQSISRTVAIVFLTELLRLPRRALINKLLGELQNKGLLNTMHILLVYIQTALLEEQPMAASLLLQLDLLLQPRRYSVYREEALESIVAALHCETNAKAQVQSAEALLILGGRFSYLGRNLLEAFLLKKAGLEDDFIDSLKEEQGTLEDTVERWNEDKKAAGDWEKKITGVVLTKGKSLFEALAKSLSSGIPDLAKPCLVTATWLSDALASMPDNGMQLVACSILLPQLVKILQPDYQLEERVLASLSLHSYMKNPECIPLLSNFAQEIVGPLARLKWITWTAKEVLNIVTKDSLRSLKWMLL